MQKNGYADNVVNVLPEGIEIIDHGDERGKSLLSHRAYKTGEKIFQMIGKVMSESELTEEQMEYALHIDRIDGEDIFLHSEDGFDNNLNHQCGSPFYMQFVKNSQTGLIEIWLTAREDVQPGPEGIELSFDYDLSERGRGFDFVCRCGSPQCRGRVSGFANLPREEQKRLYESGLLAPYLVRYYNET